MNDVEEDLYLVKNGKLKGVAYLRLRLFSGI